MKYFGQGCKHFSGRWDDEFIYKREGIDYKQFIPELVYCNHPKNKEDVEGNCRKELCPLLKEGNK